MEFCGYKGFYSRYIIVYTTFSSIADNIPQNANPHQLTALVAQQFDKVTQK
jgi:hypothetical protein